MRDGRHTCRGQLEPHQYNLPYRIPMSEGPLSRRGWRVVFFRVEIADPVAGDEDVGGKLATESLANGGTQSGQVWDWDDSREIAWATDFSPNNSYRHAWTGPQLVDEDNVVYDDLQIYVGSDNGSSRGINYFVVLEPITLTPSERIFAIIRNRSQSLD